jgi:hypothetical protein
MLWEAIFLVVISRKISEFVQQLMQFAYLFGFQYLHVDIFAPKATTFQFDPSLTATVAAPAFPSVTNIICPAGLADGTPATS